MQQRFGCCRAFDQNASHVQRLLVHGLVRVRIGRDIAEHSENLSPEEAAEKHENEHHDGLQRPPFVWVHIGATRARHKHHADRESRQ
eukprot:7387517-Prymnesium_polylepis.1